MGIKLESYKDQGNGTEQVNAFWNSFNNAKNASNSISQRNNTEKRADREDAKYEEEEAQKKAVQDLEYAELNTIGNNTNGGTNTLSTKANSVQKAQPAKQKIKATTEQPTDGSLSVMARKILSGNLTEKERKDIITSKKLDTYKKEIDTYKRNKEAIAAREKQLDNTATYYQTNFGLSERDAKLKAQISLTEQEKMENIFTKSGVRERKKISEAINKRAGEAYQILNAGDGVKDPQQAEQMRQQEYQNYYVKMLEQDKKNGTNHTADMPKTYNRAYLNDVMIQSSKFGEFAIKEIEKEREQRRKIDFEGEKTKNSKSIEGVKSKNAIRLEGVKSKNKITDRGVEYGYKESLEGVKSKNAIELKKTKQGQKDNLTATKEKLINEIVTNSLLRTYGKDRKDSLKIKAEISKIANRMGETRTIPEIILSVLDDKPNKKQRVIPDGAVRTSKKTGISEKYVNGEWVKQ